MRDSRGPANVFPRRNRGRGDHCLINQPTTRAEIEEIPRSVVFRGTLDQLIELGLWIPLGAAVDDARPPVTFVVDPRVSGAFRAGKPADSCQALQELRSAGLLEGAPHSVQFQVSTATKKPRGHRKAKSELFRINYSPRA